MKEPLFVMIKVGGLSVLSARGSGPRAAATLPTAGLAAADPPRNEEEPGIIFPVLLGRPVQFRRTL